MHTQTASALGEPLGARQAEGTMDERRASLNQPLAGLRRFVSRLTLSEISGAMGDLGTYIPIVIALSIQYGLSLRMMFSKRQPLALSAEISLGLFSWCTR